MPRPAAAQTVRYGVDRRYFLRYLSLVSAIPTLSLFPAGPVLADLPDNGDLFTLGVASGDPAPDGVVIWTRLSQDPLSGAELPPQAVQVRWEVARDEQFADVVRQGVAHAVPQLGHSVHVEVEGLEPDRWYFYRFHVGRQTSPVGRTRTTPAFDSQPEQMRFAFTSCQHFETGFFDGYGHMVNEDLDLCVHLGDYIYEYGGQDKRPRKHLGREIMSLADYRLRYSQYRADQFLQEAHRQFPWLVTWDDHEFDNNYANLVSEEEGIAPEDFLVRRMNAYQAYYEFMPLRRRSFPQGPDMKLYRRCQWGQLANFHVLDTRQYRTDQPNGDHQKPMIDGALDPQGTMLGDQQERWLMGNLLRSRTTWNVLAQQVMMAPLNRGTLDEPKYSMDQWPGYEIQRRRLLQFFGERRIPNPVVLTGDIHINWVNDLQRDFGDPKSPIVGTEFVGTSLTSSGNGGNFIPEYERAASQNEFVKFYNNNRGYVVCDLTPERWVSRFRITPFVDRPGAPIETRAVFQIENGRPGAVQV